MGRPFQITHRSQIKEASQVKVNTLAQMLHIGTTMDLWAQGVDLRVLMGPAVVKSPET